MPRIHLRITDEMDAQLKKLSAQRGIRPNQLLLSLVEKGLFSDVIDSSLTENLSAKQKLAQARKRVMFKSILETLLISRCLLMAIDKQSSVEAVIKKANQLVAQYYGETKDNTG